MRRLGISARGSDGQIYNSWLDGNVDYSAHRDGSLGNLGENSDIAVRNRFSFTFAKSNQGTKINSMTYSGTITKTLLVLSTIAYMLAAVVVLFPQDQDLEDWLSSRIAAAVSIPISVILVVFSLYVAFCRSNNSSGEYKFIAGASFALSLLAMGTAAYSAYLWYELDSVYECPVCEDVSIDGSVCTGGACYCSETCYIWESDCFNSCPCLFDDSSRAECSSVTAFLIDNPPLTSDTKYYEESSYVKHLLLALIGASSATFLMNWAYSVFRMRKIDSGATSREYESNDGFYH